MWSPNRLAEAAVNISNSSAILLFFLGFTIEIAIPLGIVSASMDEPFPTLEPFMKSALRLIPFIALIGGTVLLVITTLFLIVMFAIDHRQPEIRANSKARLVILAPTCLILPALAGAFLFACHVVADPGFGLVLSPKPLWISSPIIFILGAGWWWPVGLVLLIFITMNGLFRLKRLNLDNALDPDVPYCRTCGYILKGLKQPRCPECGASFLNEVLQKFRHDNGERVEFSPEG